jgi:hypothetical protein
VNDYSPPPAWCRQAPAFSVPIATYAAHGCYEPGRSRSSSDRMDWARSYSKLGGALESQRRGLFLLGVFGHQLLGLPSEQAVERMYEMDRAVRDAHRRATKPVEPRDEASISAAVEEDDWLEEDEAWRTELLRHLHALTPSAFEEFVIYLLRTYSLQPDWCRWERSRGDRRERSRSHHFGAVVARLQAKRYEPDSDWWAGVVTVGCRTSSRLRFSCGS